jgi:hypothetical protein
MVVTKRLGFNSSLEQIYGIGLKNLFTDKAGVRGFYKSGFGSLLIMKTVERS